MENSVDCRSHPNLNSEAYRNLTDRSSDNNKQLQVILIDEDGTVFLGASNMTDRYWNGSISIFKSLDIKRSDPLSSLKTESGISDAVSLGNNKYIIGEDSGIIQITELKENNETKAQELSLIGYAFQHDNSIMSLSVFHSKKYFASGGMDFSIKLWNTAELSLTHSYAPAHVDVVSCVTTHPSNDNVFASCCWDGDALLWDIRKPKHAKSIYRNDCGLSALDWRPDNENTLAIGHHNGFVKIIDIRNPDVILWENQIFKNRIHRINYHHEKSHLIAVCSDDVVIKVVDSDQDFSIVLEDDLHTDFVRSLAWHKNELFSCSWDDTIQRRSLPLTE